MINKELPSGWSIIEGAYGYNTLLENGPITQRFGKSPKTSGITNFLFNLVHGLAQASGTCGYPIGKIDQTLDNTPLVSVRMWDAKSQAFIDIWMSKQESFKELENCRQASQEIKQNLIARLGATYQEGMEYWALAGRDYRDDDYQTGISLLFSEQKKLAQKLNSD